MLLHTWSDLQAVPPKRLWQRLRTMRNAPPGAAAKGHRRETFSAAMEQAEQLFKAASSIGVATQPILTFYGVSQMGRAIAAMAPGLSNKEYRLSGHGITDHNMQMMNANLSRIRLRSERGGSFPTVARALNSCRLVEEVTLGTVWGLIPDSARFALPGSGAASSLVATIDGNDLHVQGHDEFQCRIEAFPIPESPHPASYIGDMVQGPSVDPARIEEQRRLLREWFGPYPALTEAALGYSSPLQPIHVSYSDSGILNVPVRIRKEPDASSHKTLDVIAPSYHGINRIFPDLDGCGRPLEPFMAWWAVLYVLSRLARYVPNEWDELIRVDGSPAAVAIEYLLDEAQIGVPELALSAIERLEEQNIDQGH